MAFSLHTPVCDLLGCEYPVLLAGMGGVARSELVVAVSEAGGFGFLGMVRESPQLITEEIAKVRAGTNRDFGVNLIPAATNPELLDAEIVACIAARVPVMALFWDLSADIINRLRDAGILVVCQVGGLKEAEDAQRAGAQILVAQGVEAGGHVRGVEPLGTFLPKVVANTDVPVIASGGMADGRGLAAALDAGAQGAMFGTAFLATRESFAHDFHKQRIVETKPGATVRTDAFHVNWPQGAFVRVLPNSVTRGERGDPFSGNRQAIGKEDGRTIWLFSTDSPLRSMTGDFEAMALYAGQGAGRIESIVPARERFATIVAEAERILGTVPDAEHGAAADPATASPVCYASTADETYMGYADRDELLAFLNELLEAERAGARVAARTASETSDPKLKSLMRDIYRDEARWCAMLLKWIGHLNGEASPRTGAFYEKCMAIGTLPERTAFLNRGQGWVARKLREMLPRTRDDALHADFADMLKSHEENIARANDALK
jgi:nitronate monooxygenase